ncbi:MAG: endolytic transglycosylase MltG [Bacteroidales bacterium]|nr:endolytic transglycosylase MltG [Bacteroidales bacterium]
MLAFRDTALVDSLGFNAQTFPAMFIPNTYELYWTVTAKGFIVRMHKEYQQFWDRNRTEKLQRSGLSQLEVSALAAIVDEETRFNSEKPRVAGVYVNRLKKGMKLQADPTVKFAVGNFNIKRVLHAHLAVASPYNTYKNYGLPPGPIRIPSIAGIDAVLNYEKHEYIYFCANADFSGKHAFAKTLAQHNANAAKYRRALNRNKIWR